MLAESTILWGTVERWSSWAFVVAGLGWIGSAVLQGVQLVTVYAHGLGNLLVGSTAMLAATIGVLGVYLGLVDRMPRVALGGALFAGATAVGLAVNVAWAFGTALVGLSLPPAVLRVLPLLLLVVFGVVGLVTDEPSRAVGLLVLGFPTAVILAAVVSGWTQVALTALLGVDGLAIGYVQYAGSARLGSVDPSPGSTT